jgi:hypothetical protein
MTQEKVRMSGPSWEQRNPHLTSSWQTDEWGATGIRAWRYKDPVDLSNNGKPEYVLVWRGYGLLGARNVGCRLALNPQWDIGLVNCLWCFSRIKNT